MKKVLALVLAWVMLLGCVPGTAEGQERSVLPAVGDVISGFEVKEIRDLQMYGAK